MQPVFEAGVEPNALSFPISKILNMVPITPNSMESSVSKSDESIHVSLSILMVSKYLKFQYKVFLFHCFCCVFVPLPSSW